jgi:hypothetical protein
VISVEVACLATPGKQWRAVFHSWALSARINPSSPVFAGAIRHLQEVLTAAAHPLQAARIAAAQVMQALSQLSPMGVSPGHVAAVAVVGTLGVLVITRPGYFSMGSLLSQGHS